MRHTTIALIIFGIFSTAQAQECQLQQTIRSNSISTISEIKNITTNVITLGAGQKKCVASFDGLYNGDWHKSFGEYSWTGDRSITEMCGIAVSLAKKNLLQPVNSSTINNESIVVCRDNTKPKVVSTAVGMVIEDITQLRPHPKFQKTFRYKDTQCRWFVEAGWSGKDLQKMNGIACLTSNRQWVVVDKF